MNREALLTNYPICKGELCIFNCEDTEMVARRKAHK